MKITSEWRKSTRSGSTGQCVEVRRCGLMIEVRDSKDPSGPTLGFTEPEFAAFLQGVADGEFQL